MQMQHGGNAALLRAASKTKLSEKLKSQALLKPSKSGRSRNPVIHVALIARAQTIGSAYGQFDSNREDGGWYALMGSDREKLIEQAQAKVREFSVGLRRYEVWLGTLSEKVIVPSNFKIVKL